MGSSGWTTAFLLLFVAWEAKGNGNSGSKCPGTNCTPAPAGTTCTSTFDRDDGCCPVWHCANGQTVYGKSSSNSFSTSSFSSFGTGGAPGMPPFPGFGGPPGFPPGFPFFGRR